MRVLVVVVSFVLMALVERRVRPVGHQRRAPFLGPAADAVAKDTIGTGRTRARRTVAIDRTAASLGGAALALVVGVCVLLGTGLASAERRLDKAKIRQLGTCRWVVEHQNVVITGATGTGKTYLAMAAAVNALLKNQVERVILGRIQQVPIIHQPSLRYLDAVGLDQFLDRPRAARWER